METQKPVHEAKRGRIKAAIWANETITGVVRHNVTLGRSYKVGDTWGTTHTLGADDIVHAIRALEEADAWIRRNASTNPKAEVSAEEAR